MKSQGLRIFANNNIPKLACISETEEHLAAGPVGLWAVSQPSELTACDVTGKAAYLIPLVDNWCGIDYIAKVNTLYLITRSDR